MVTWYHTDHINVTIPIFVCKCPILPLARCRHEGLPMSPIPTVDPPLPPGVMAIAILVGTFRLGWQWAVICIYIHMHTCVLGVNTLPHGQRERSGMPPQWDSGLTASTRLKLWVSVSLCQSIPYNREAREREGEAEGAKKERKKERKKVTHEGTASIDDWQHKLEAEHEAVGEKDG